MNLKEAYSILEIPQNTTSEDAKKQYRKLTKKYHPDVNKEAGAEDKFKKINEAYQVVSSGKGTDPQPVTWSGNPFTGGRQKTYQAENIRLETSISFAQSVLGCNQEIELNRKKKCKSCEGQGEYSLNNGCVKCGGKGQVVTRQGSAIMIQTCDKCGGRTQKSSCNVCKTSGIIEEGSTVTVSIPGGVVDNNVLRLTGMGNFVGSFMTMDQYTDVHLTIHVSSEPSLKIEGKDVVYTLQLPLLDALRGCQRKVLTIKGQQEIQVPAMSKNKEEVVIPKLGVSGQGNQRIILDVRYPDDVSSIIDLLNHKEL